MKYMLGFLIASISYADCTSNVRLYSVPATYNVNTDRPKFLKNATITVTLENGESSTVSADEYMVVKRRQTIVAGENKILFKESICKNNTKNLLTGELRKDYTNLDVVKVGNEVDVYSNKRPIPGINYYRRDILDTLGAGVGVDSNGTLKALIGVDF